MSPRRSFSWTISILDPHPSKRPVFLRTRPPQRRAPAPNVTNLLLRARLARAILRHHAALRLEQIERLHQRLVRQHPLRQAIVKGRVQRSTTRPAPSSVIYATSVIFEVPDGSGPGKGLRDVGEVGLEVDDGEGFGVDLEGLVAGVEAGQGGDGGADVSDCEGVGEVNVGGVAEGGFGGVGVYERGRGVVVEDLELVLVRFDEWCQWLGELKWGEWSLLWPKKMAAMVAGEKRRTME